MGNYLDANGLGKYTQLIKNGYMPGATVGSAEQITTDVGAIDKVPYNFRTSGGSIDIGDRERDKIVGGTLAWNQQMNPAMYSASGALVGLTITNNGDGSITINGTSTEAATISVFSSISDSPSYWSKCAGHKVLFAPNVKNAPSSGLVVNYQGFVTSGIGINHADHRPMIIPVASDIATFDTVQIYVRTNSGISYNNTTIKPMAFDLTQMFGSAIADYLYNLEQATADSTYGDGVKWFLKNFPNYYYAYNAGQLMNVKTSAHNMTGFNFVKSYYSTGAYVQYNAVARGTVAKLVPDQNYCISFTVSGYTANCTIKVAAWCSTAFRGVIVTANGRYTITFTTPSIGLDAAVSTEQSLLQNETAGLSSPLIISDVCINLSWDGSRNGEYEPYELHSYPLDADLELRGVPKLDANNALYYDGDIYKADGAVTRKYYAVDLGTLSWGKGGGNNLVFVTSSLTTGSHKAKGAAWSSGVFNGITSNGAYRAIRGSDVYNHVYDMTMGMASDGMFYIYDSAKENLTAAEFKDAMSGVYLVYELATPTTETADPYAVTQIVNDFGTEEYVDTRDVPVPVGHETFYQVNLKSKLEMAPNSPSDGNGDYIVRQTDGVNAYVPLVIPNELPDAPSEDGAYQLTVTVTDGEPVYSWEAVE